MMNRTQLMDEETEMITGGNYGDADNDNGEQSRYKVGDIVEVFTSCFHITTHSDKIIQVKKREGNLFMKERWIYITENGENVSADHIESR